MYCPNCGNQCDGNFCPNCGTPLSSTPVNNTYSESSSSSSPRKKPFYKKKRFIIPIVILLLVVIDNIWVDYNKSLKPTDDNPTPVLYTYSYTNRFKQSYSFNYDLESCVFYERSVNTLIKEWHDNIALAEKTYGNGNAFIITDGYIERIRKNEFDNDAYYISLVQDKDSLNLLGTEEIDVYFRSSELTNALMDYKTGDYIVLICYLEKSTIVFEHPQLNAHLILEPIVESSESKNAAVDNTLSTKSVITLSDDYESESTSNGNDMASFLDRKVVDVIAEFGSNYTEQELWQFSFPNTICPYSFFYQGSRPPINIELMSGWISAIETDVPGTHILKDIEIGCSMEQTEERLDSNHYQIIQDTDRDNNYEGIYQEDNIIYYLSFDKDQVLYRAICRISDDAPISPKIFSLCVMQDDFEKYLRGDDSVYPELWADSIGYDSYQFFQLVIENYNMYVAESELYPDSQSKSVWDTLSSVYTSYNSGEMQQSDPETFQAFNTVIISLSNRIGYIQ